MPEDECRPVEIDGEIVRVRGGREMNDAARAALAEVIRAAKRKLDAMPPAQRAENDRRFNQVRERARAHAEYERPS